MKRSGALVLAGVITLGMTSPAMAGLFERGKSVEGTVDHMEGPWMLVNSEDPKNNSISQVAVEVNLNTRFQEVDALDQIKEGDRVRVQYTEEEQRKIATAVSKLEPEEGQQQF